MAFTFDGTALFWASVVLLFYTHFGYPALVWIWAWLRPRPPRALGYEPEVSVVVVAQDEAPRIEARIDNLLALDYPKDRLTILIASDGSTDGTAERARAYEQKNVRVFAFSEPRGKPAALNDTARSSKPKAQAHDRPSTTAEQQFQSKVRTIAGSFQLFRCERWLLNPLRNRL